MILNDKQEQELLKFFENEVNASLDINPLDLMHEVAKVLLNSEANIAKKELEYNMKDHLMNCLDPEHFIYYLDAMDYLREEDASLRQSLTIAKEFYTAKEFDNISSTTLANLLYHQKQIEMIDNIDFDYIIETIIKNQ
jgi:hypothetical protein